jgi:hypothetical protein
MPSPIGRYGVVGEVCLDGTLLLKHIRSDYLLIFSNLIMSSRKTGPSLSLSASSINKTSRENVQRKRSGFRISSFVKGHKRGSTCGILIRLVIYLWNSIGFLQCNLNLGALAPNMTPFKVNQRLSRMILARMRMEMRWKMMGEIEIDGNIYKDQPLNFYQQELVPSFEERLPI